MKAKLHNLNFLEAQWDFLALAGLAPSWLGVYFFLRLHAAAEKSDPFSLDIRDDDQRQQAGVFWSVANRGGALTFSVST